MRVSVVLLLVGCGRIAFDPLNGDGSVDVNVGPEIRDEEGSHSGARLKIVWNELGTQTRTFASIYDAQRGEKCQLRDGRCVPPDMSLVYRDGGCTELIARRYSCIDDAVYAYGTVGADQRLFERGASLPGVTTFYALDTGTCMPYVAQAGDLFELGAEVPISELAAVTTVLETGPRVVKQFVEATDGFRLETSAFDTALDVLCVPGTSATGEGCLPIDGVGVYSNFSDPTCTQPVLQYPLAFVPKFGVDFGQCTGVDSHYYPVTGPAPTNDAYTLSGQTCFATTAANGTTMWTLGAQVTPAPLTRRMGSVAGERIQHIYDEADGVALRFGLFDSAIGGRCVLSRLDDGKQHCIQFETLSIASFYSDAGCTTAIGLAYSYYAAGCAAGSPRYAQRSMFAGCTTTRTIYNLGSVYTGTVYIMSGTCIPNPLGAGILSTYFNLGPPASPATFVEAIAVRDP